MKKKIAMMLTAVMLTASVAACGGTAQESTGSSAAASSAGAAAAEDTAAESAAPAATQDGGDVHMNAALYWFGTSLDPHKEYDGWTTSRAGITETLVTVNENYELVPLLADSWEQTDETTWNLHIRDGITFHNGKAVDGEAVKKSFERCLEQQERAVTSSHIESIEADGQNVIFHTSDLNAAFLASISEPLFSVIDVDAGTDFEKQPIATGPFMVKGFEVDTFIEMENYDDYWNGASQVDTVTVKCIADDSTRSLALQSGEIDIAQRVNNTDLQTLQNDANYQVIETLGARTRIIVFNYMNKFLSDINVRKAIAASINYEKLVKILGQSVGMAGAPYPSSSPYGYETLEKQTYDAEAAAKYLADSGFEDTDGDGYVDKDGEKLSVTMNYAISDYTTMLEAIQSMAKASGIDLQLNLVDSIMEMTQGQTTFDIVVTNWQVLSTGDPQWFIDSQYKTGAANNGGHYSNANVDALVEELAKTTDVTERQNITIEIEKELLADCASVYVVGETNFVIANSKVANATAYPIDYYFLDNKITMN